MIDQLDDRPNEKVRHERGQEEQRRRQDEQVGHQLV
jgi:hypothetical protein